MRRTIIFSILLMTLALALWGAYGYIVLSFGSERDAYATLLSDNEMKDARERAVSRLRGSVRDTREERETLESLVAVDVIQAVSTIEAVGEATGATVRIDGATSGAASEHVRTIVVAVTLEGSQASILRALTVLETLPFPAVVENVDLTGTQEGEWSARLRVRFITTSNIGA